MKKLVVLLLLLVAQPAAAWDQYRTLAPGDNGEPRGCGIRWAVNEIPLALEATPLDGLVTVDIQAIAAASGATWQNVRCGLCQVCQNGQEAPQACALNPLGLQLRWLPRGKPTVIGATCTSVKQDGLCDTVSGNGNWVNIIHAKEVWQAQGVSSLVVALTVLTYDRTAGEIRDADVLLDDWGHDFCVAPDCTFGEYDLQSTLTHEFGHVLGLDHTTDLEATMYVGADPKESKKQTLNDDDVSGICHAYRTTCYACTDAPAPSGCQAGSMGNGWSLLLLALVWARIRRARN